MLMKNILGKYLIKSKLSGSIRSKVKLIIFDFDGVFADSKQGYLYYFKKILSKYGWKMNYKDIEPALGPKSHTVIAKLIKRKNDDPLVLKMAEEVDKELTRYGMRFIKLRKKTIETLEKLYKRHILVLRTNSRKMFVSAVLNKFSIKSKFYSKFNALVFAEDMIDKEAAIKYFMKLFNAGPTETVYIGDMANDVQVAKKIGCISIAIVGWHTAGLLAKEKPDYLIRNLSSLNKIIREIEH
ncbi:MAG: HAD hydrolase-like protein [Candidatus Micrarchaeia archaeon]